MTAIDITTSPLTDTGRVDHQGFPVYAYVDGDGNETISDYSLTAGGWH